MVPVDAADTPTTRWRTNMICMEIKNVPVAYALSPIRLHVAARDLDGRRLEFLNDKQPAPRFLYFHFVSALVHVKDSNRRGRQEIWQNYFHQFPFPTPGLYVQRSLAVGMATYFGVGSAESMNYWMKGHGFDSVLRITPEEINEVSHQVHMIMDAIVERCE
ncbi:hypothetical protein CORC01_12067 [Colletotrichum orchidophilum]|uniref:Uncharacterized protein n=1 Tax=Colletotrichum orchidophilum TaxID=1209926 RepID=A0A1G4AU37_9PEZI|nr:uncharacterized protein CORC01_12067 [Colletotrichum orchidophilum]OHE92621.1 hypothetical protein CORC01_12067 [Colletotrichum orchidophilum]